jgi:hypothetical protein
LPIVSGRPKISPIVFLLTLVLLVLCILGIILTMRRSAQRAVPVFPPLASVLGSFGEREGHSPTPMSNFFLHGLLLDRRSGPPLHLSS